MVEANPDKIAAIRRTIPYFFFQLIKGTNGYFHSPPSISEIGFVMNMTRHLGGKENKAVIETWMKAMIERLDHVAAIAAEDDGPVLQDFETRSEWEQAVLAIHGRPLPIELLDPESKVDPLQFDQLACAALARIDPTENPLLVPVADLVAMGFTAAPYRCAG